MTYGQPARSASRRFRSTVLAALMVVGAGLTGVFTYQSLAASRSPAESPSPADSTSRVGPSPSIAAPSPVASPDGIRQGPPGEADGVVPDGVTVFDSQYPAVAKLDPALLRALREATSDAAGDGVEIFVDSGWRSKAYQNQLLREAIAEYGSEAKAARWVAPADTSAHVAGEAVDVGPADAAAWLSKHGVGFGLCQIYTNEPWHFELRSQAVDRGCPPMYADPTQDPRLRQ